MEKLWINPRYGCKTVSSIIYVVGENCWEMVAWRMKSMFLCIKMIHDKVLVSSFFFPHPPTSPLLPTFPLYFSSSIPIAVTFVSYPECAVSSVRTTASFPLGEALFLYLLPTWFGWGWLHLQSPGLAISHAWLAEVQDSSNYGDWLEMG